MNAASLDREYLDMAQQLHAGHMSRLGIADTMRLARAYNGCKFAREKAWRDSLYRELCPGKPTLQLHDGWALDTSLSLPHLERVLEDSDRIIAERRGVRRSQVGAYRSYFQNLFTLEDARAFPAFLDFATSPELVSVVAHHLQTVPALSTTLPPGIRLVESNAAFDDAPEVAKDSQLFHIDYYSLPNIYVLVLLADTTLEHGPWTFLPRGVSQRVRDELGYWKPGCGYRLTDEQVFSKVSPEEVLTFTYPRGTVLFIESSGCLHYGSRNSVKPRFQLMLGYTGACRTDFSEVFMPNNSYHARPYDSLLAQLVLNKYLRAPNQPEELDASQLAALHGLMNGSAATR